MWEKTLTKTFLNTEYSINKKMPRRIAKEVGCYFLTIFYYLKKYKIHIRNQSESAKLKVPITEKTRQRMRETHARGINHWRYGRKDTFWKGKHPRLGYKEDKDHVIDRIKKSLVGLHLSPNKKEQLLLNIVKPNFRFVGNAKKFIEQFCPDFIDEKNKKIIELYGDYWHNLPSYKERDKRRIKSYNHAGYKTLIIWEKELKNIDKVKRKINNFIKKV